MLHLPKHFMAGHVLTYTYLEKSKFIFVAETHWIWGLLGPWDFIPLHSKELPLHAYLDCESHQ